MINLEGSFKLLGHLVDAEVKHYEKDLRLKVLITISSFVFKMLCP